MTEFLSAENVTPAEIHCRLQNVYGENTVNRSTVSRWAIKFREYEPGRVNIVDQPRSGRPASVTDDKHQKQIDELIMHDRHITQKQIAGRLGMSKESSVELGRQHRRFCCCMTMQDRTLLAQRLMLWRR